MKERLLFLLYYFLFWVVYFVAARLIFLGYHIADAQHLTLKILGGIFYYGIAMDLSMAAYLCVIPFLIVAFSNFAKKSRVENWIFSYTVLLIFVFSFLIVADLQVFNVWGYRIDATPLIYLKSPKEAWASASSSPLLALLISFVLLLIVATYIVYRLIAKIIDSWNHIPTFPMMPVVLFLTAALILPIRGGFQLSPMSQSTVYFSENNFANIAAVNAPWNFFSSIVNKTYKKDNPYTYLPKQEIDSIFKELFANSNATESVLRKDIAKPNVLLIVWESFTKKAITYKTNNDANLAITPNFNRLTKEGIYFSNTYASGDRTYKALPAILSGFPAEPTVAIIEVPNKSVKLPVLSKDFEQNGYRTSFHYGGETEFANIKSYLYSSYFQNIITKNDFNKSDWNSKWGAHDGVVFNRLLQDLNKSQEPFFSTMLTLSSHEPFEVPMENVISGNDEEHKFMNSMYYADKALGEFIENAKKQPWWKNTLVIIVADHGSTLPKSNKIDDFTIPMLWLGGALEKTGIEVSKICSQTDIASTLLAQLKLKNTAYSYSKNIFDPKTKQWAYFAFNDGFGFIQPQKEIIFDNIGKRIIQQKGTILEKDIDFGKAMEQRTFQDYLDK